MIEQTDVLTIAVIVGSVRRPRVGRAVADWFAGRAAGHPGVAVDLVDLATVDLPLSGVEPGGTTGSALSDRLTAADGFVVVTPEYNHSFPAALKNAIDWHYREWMFKPVAFVSYGAGTGGARAVEQLRLVFAELFAATTRTGVVINAPWERISAAGFSPDDGLDRAAAATVDELLWWTRALQTARRDHPFAR
jgi:NAD(P)H-dependent FMN reductase